jgi:hypothetical protein
MSLLEKSDLEFKYTWTTIHDDDPKITGKPDSTLLNRQEGYEVLAFINRFANKHNFKQKKSGLKVERLINKNLPGNTRSHANVAEWLVKNWGNYS